jgi:signal transduction histidine kinase
VGLRWKILLITVLTPLALGLTSLWIVHINVSSHVNTSSIHESLERSSSVFESMLTARSNALAVTARVIVQDPRFFSLVGLRQSQRDGRFRLTVRGMAHDFQRITGTDLFEVIDRKAVVLASAGTEASLPEARKPFLRDALRGRIATGILIEGRSHFQVVAMPVTVDRQTVGALLLGANIGTRLARELRQQTRSEVTFVSGQLITGSTLEDDRDREALLSALDNFHGRSAGDFSRTGITEVKGPLRTFFTVARNIPLSEAGQHQLYVMQRSADPEISFLRKMQSYLLLLGALAVIVALASGFVFSERLTRPLERLVRGAQEMERGNYQFPIDVRGRDEIGYLADRFQLMRQHERVYVNSLEEATRLKSVFISFASRELRTPISVIRGYHDLLAEGQLGPLLPQQQQALRGIGDSLSNLLKVADDATLMAQVQGERSTLERASHDVAELLDAAIGTALAQAPTRAVKVTRRESRSLGTAAVDGRLLTQAVANLVANGIRFTPDGGKVEVDAEVSNGELVVQVRDTGVGIGPEKLGRLFEKAYLLSEIDSHPAQGTLEFNKPGLGFGLSIVRAIVEAHGGTISVESAAKRGSTFAIRVPLDIDQRLRTAA